MFFGAPTPAELQLLKEHTDLEREFRRVMAFDHADDQAAKVYALKQKIQKACLDRYQWGRGQAIAPIRMAVRYKHGYDIIPDPFPSKLTVRSERWEKDHA